MSDVKSFTGFIAIDGSTHTTMKVAVEHSREVKIKAALEAFAQAPQDTSQVAHIEKSNSDVARAIYMKDMPAFLIENRVAILAAFNQEVLTRKKRVAKAPKVASTNSDTNGRGPG